MMETERLRIYTASGERMTALIAEQTDDAVKAAYTEMLDGCMSHPAA